jgi:hypothetical protein
MVTRVSSFLEQKHYKLNYSANDKIMHDKIMQHIVANHTLDVSPGENINHADLTIQYSDKISLRIKLRDLHQENSPMIQSMEDSVVEDTSSEDFDYWDPIPPFGVVEVYGYELHHHGKITETEITALFILLDILLTDTFMLFTFRSSEIKNIANFMQTTINGSNIYLHDGEICYRPRMYG